MAAEGTYEYECMRAELLGIEKPDYEEWLKKQPETTELTEEEIEIGNLKDAESTNEPIGRISGGLDELNSILKSTQRKIHTFKDRCGSLTNMLKIRIGSASTSTDVDPESAATSDVTETAQTNGNENTTQEPATQEDSGPRKSDLTKALDNHVDKIDALLEKAENAQYSMAHQNKEMKRFLR